MAFSANSMSSRHLKHTMFLKSREEIEWPQFSKTSAFEVPKIFSEFFSPSFRLGSALRLPPRVRGLPRRNTAALRSRERPRHRGGAAPGGQGGRGCAGQIRPWPRRRIWGGKNLLRRWDSVVKGTWNEDVDGLSVWWILFSQFIGKFAKTFAQMFGVVLCEHNYIVPTLRVGVSLNQGFQSGNRGMPITIQTVSEVPECPFWCGTSIQSTTACWRFMFW